MYRKYRACEFLTGTQYFVFLYRHFGKRGAIQIANCYLDSQRGEVTLFCRQLYKATQLVST